jgi:uncharacterized protein (DUF2062 family)
MLIKRRRCPALGAVWRWILGIPARLNAIPQSPHDIAKAFAVGVFIGILPGMGSVVAVLAAFVFRLSKVATLLGSLLTNPWTVAFVYAASFKIGRWVLGHTEPIDWKQIFSLRTGWPAELGRTLPPLVVGGVTLGLILSLISYSIVRFFVTRYQATLLKRLP